MFVVKKHLKDDVYSLIQLVPHKALVAFSIYCAEDCVHFTDNPLAREYIETGKRWLNNQKITNPVIKSSIYRDYSCYCASRITLVIMEKSSFYALYASRYCCDSYFYNNNENIGIRQQKEYQHKIIARCLNYQIKNLPKLNPDPSVFDLSLASDILIMFDLLEENNIPILVEDEYEYRLNIPTEIGKITGSRNQIANFVSRNADLQLIIKRLFVYLD